MYMSDADIVKEYHEARRKKEQIEILADQNLCSKEAIVRVLLENGVEGTDIPIKLKKRNTGNNQKKTVQKENDMFSSVISSLRELSESINADIEKKKIASDNISVAADLLVEAKEILFCDDKNWIERSI